eukprot:1003721-Rhodomonas_salina.1
MEGSRQHTTQPQQVARNTPTGSSATQPHTCRYSGMCCGGTHISWHRSCKAQVTVGRENTAGSAGSCWFAVAGCRVRQRR